MEVMVFQVTHRLNNMLTQFGSCFLEALANRISDLLESKLLLHVISICFGVSLLCAHLT